jgi:hypothetical protein
MAVVLAAVPHWRWQRYWWPSNLSSITCTQRGASTGIRVISRLMAPNGFAMEYSRHFTGVPNLLLRKATSMGKRKGLGETFTKADLSQLKVSIRKARRQANGATGAPMVCWISW